MALNIQLLERCIQTLESSLKFLQHETFNTIHYEVFRNATVKGFELTLEIAEKLLRKALKNYDMVPKTVDQLFYKDVFRYAGKYGLLDTSEIERWFVYRDNRNDTAHDYGESFANHTLKMIPESIKDAKALALSLDQLFNKARNA